MRTNDDTKAQFYPPAENMRMVVDLIQKKFENATGRTVRAKWASEHLENFRDEYVHWLEDEVLSLRSLLAETMQRRLNDLEEK